MQITQIMVTRVQDLTLLINPHLLLTPSQLASRLQVARARNSASGGRPYAQMGNQVLELTDWLGMGRWDGTALSTGALLGLH